MANAKKSSSSKKAATKKVVKKIEEEEKDFDLDEDLDDEVIEDMDFDLDDDDDEFGESKELEELSTDERLIRVEKKTKIILVLQIVGLVLMLFTLIVCISGSKGDKKESNNSSNNSSENSESSSNNYSTDSFKEITFGDISSMSKNGEIVVFLGRQGCYWCSLYAPLIGMEAIDNNFDVYYLDFGKIIDFTTSPATISDSAAYDGLLKWVQNSSYADSVADGIGTPITFFVKNNKIVNMINGYTDQSSLETILKKEGFIK